MFVRCRRGAGVVLLLKRRRFFASATSFSSSSNSANNVSSTIPIPPVIIERPPFPIRVLLVSSSVGLATPLFAIAGVARTWSYWMPKSQVGNVFKYLIAAVIGGGSTTLIYNHVGPFVRDHSEFLLPFSLSNAAAAAFWYATLETIFGIEFMAGTMTATMSAAMPSFIARAITAVVAPVAASTSILPIGGLVVGALTALTSPLLWPAAFKLCWSEELQSLILSDNALWITDAYTWIAVPVGLPIGLLAGLSMHTALKPVIYGLTGVSWTKRSLPVLAILLAASTAYYTICKTDPEELRYELRRDPLTGREVSVSYRTQTTLSDGGAAAKRGELQRSVASVVHKIRQPFSALFNEIEASRSPPINLELKQLDEKDWTSKNSYKNRSLLYSLIDLLLRLKHLDMAFDQHSLQGANVEDKTSTADLASKRTQLEHDKAEIIALASSKYKIKDLAKLLQHCELGILLARKCAAPSTAADAEQHLLLRNIKQQMTLHILEDEKSYKSDDDDEAFTNKPERLFAIQFLGENFHLLDKELKAKINYEHKASVADEKKLIEKFTRDTYFYDLGKWLRSPLVLTSALATGLLASYFGSR